MKNNNRKQKAFTLAETLITLGVIGIVAALTLPSIIANYQKKILKNRFKKMYRELTQATQLLAVNEDINIFEYAKSHDSQAALDKLMSQMKKTSRITGTRGHYNYLYQPLHPDKKHRPGQYCDFTTTYASIDGIFFVMDNSPNDLSISDPKLCVDTNGYSLPNALGYDLFVFIFTPDGKLVPFTYKWNVLVTTEKLEDISTQCTPSNGFSCSFYALEDKNPQNPNQNYWEDFLK